MKGDGGDPRWAPPQRHNDSESPNATLQSRADRFWGVAIFQIRSQAGRAFAGTLYLMSRIISVIIQERVSSSAQLKVRQKSHLIFYLEYFPVWITCFYFPQHLTDTHSDWFRGTLIQTLLSDTCGIWWSSNLWTIWKEWVCGNFHRRCDGLSFDDREDDSTDGGCFLH